MVKTSFTVKPSSIEEPKYYLGSDVGKLYYEDGSYAWTMVYKTHVEKYIKNLKNKLKSDGFIFNEKLSEVNYSPYHPFLTTSYCPEFDTLFEFSDKQVTVYHNIIGILC